MKIAAFIFLATLSVAHTSVSAQNGPAVSLEGTYVGTLRSATVDPAQEDYKIKITSTSDSTVKIQPVTGDSSSTFEAQVSLESDVYTLNVEGNKFARNGTYVESIGMLTYSLHLGGNQDANIEVFVGKKE